jgi:hypothetical protein
VRSRWSRALEQSLECAHVVREVCALGFGLAYRIPTDEGLEHAEALLVTDNVLNEARHKVHNEPRVARRRLMTGNVPKLRNRAHWPRASRNAGAARSAAA